MFAHNSPGLDVFLQWLGHGVWNLSGWQVLVYTLVTTHITIAAVTIFLHRHQAHRSLDLHWLPSHFFRFWLWIGTGMQTKAWAAIHRKHHAKCETPEDPHSPQTRGLKTVFWQGAELYRAEANNAETLAKYGHGTPDDWIERNVYTRLPWQGVALMLIVNLVLFGALGLTVWAVQMLWIPVTAAGIINGVGHFWGYRNFEAADASTNISPWGIIIGGEELHNNHHTYPTSAKLSVKSYEFDIGWLYIRILETLGLAKVKKTPPKLAFGDVQAQADVNTLEALIANRYEVMAGYARQLREACRQELQGLPQRPAEAVSQAARRWMHRDLEKVPAAMRAQLETARAALPTADTMVRMREELRQLWLSTNRSREQLAVDLQAWCRRAEDSGIAALRDFSVRLRAARA
ncbi:MAG: acyl-CoA desaturase [Limnohabitans sp.]|jgi:stearoyl-CoA desaturase (delta-9 desaturase)|nr:acyl-CoA desaturase [Limnohabitans sp.]